MTEPTPRTEALDVEREVVAAAVEWVNAHDALMVAPHPNQPHEFRTACIRCGEPGFLTISLATYDERVVTMTEEQARAYAEEKG
jgi:hypothetical protein